LGNSIEEWFLWYDLEFQNAPLTLLTELERGNSGSWVIETDTGRVCGLLVSGIASLGTGYMIPFKSILEDIDRRVRRHDYESSSHEDPTTLANRYLPSVLGRGHWQALDEED
jgi:hypothetical protein